MDLKSKIKFTVKCPKCGNPINASGADAGKDISCAKCKAVIHLKDDGFTSGINEVEKKLKNLVKR